MANLENVLEGCLLCCIGIDTFNPSKFILQDYQIDWENTFSKLLDMLEDNS